MKTIALFTLCIALLFSCKKETSGGTADTTDLRILKIKKTASNGAVFYNNFEYNQQNEIIKITYNAANAVPETIANITYNGNEVVVTEPIISNAGVNSTIQTKFTLNAEKKPLSRIQIATYEFLAPVNNPQRSFTNDTTYYEYDAAGLLSKSINRKRDSTWMQNNPAYAQTMLQITAVTKLYTNSNGNVTAVTGSGTIFSRSFNGVATNTAYQTTEESLLYDYSNSYPNKTDFTSDFILKEYEIPMTKNYTLNKLYKNIPNKITSQSSLKDAAGNLVSSTNFTANFILAYNNYNYLSGVNNPSISLNSELIYNK